MFEKNCGSCMDQDSILPRQNGEQGDSLSQN